MCEVGARCASSARQDLSKAKEKLAQHESKIHDAQKNKASKAEIVGLEQKSSELKKDVKRAQLAYDGTKSGLKELSAQGISLGEPRYDRARMKNAFNRAIHDRKKRTGAATVSINEVLSPV